MTQFKFNVGAPSQSYIGALTWNANGTLGQLAITDPFNSADNQTCNYAHDDLVRIASANCGSAANQSFSYDPFGNINKQGSPFTFNAFYTASSNRINCIGGSGQNCSGGVIPTYDANGNTTNDGTTTYTWNANGRPATINGATYTMDALDRFVEINNGSTIGQIVYAPTGERLAFMNGQTFSRAFVMLPGQGQAIYDTTNGLYYYRHSDWLGSARLGSTPQQTPNFSTAYAPFGEQYAQDPSQSDDAFIGLTPIQGLFDFTYREYNTQGRWPAPDPAGLAAVDPSNPQSWNRYAYVENDPISSVDPSGLLLEAPGGGPVTCTLDGLDTACGLVFGVLGGGGDAGAICPGNNCFNQQLTTDNDGNTVFIPQNFGLFVNMYGSFNGLTGVVQFQSAVVPVRDGYPQDGSIMSQIMNNPTSAANWTSTFNSASDWVTTATASTAIMSGGVVATGAIASLSWAQLAVGQTADGSLHFAFGANGEWAHYVLGDFLEEEGTQLSTRFAAQFAERAWLRIPVPVLNPTVIIPGAAATAANCFTGACSALLNGWFY